jgi:hypothetical protein
MTGPGKVTSVDISEFGDDVAAWVKDKVGAGGVYTVERGSAGGIANMAGHNLVSLQRADGSAVEHVPRIVSQILIGAALKATAETGRLSALGADFRLEEPTAAKRREKAAPGDPLKAMSRYEFEQLNRAARQEAMSRGIRLYD